MRGSVVLSETIIASAGILISLILVGLVVQLVFSQQTERTYESVFDSLARDIVNSIDRAAASAGSIQIQQDISKGLNLDLEIDYKSVIIKYGNNKAVKNFFIGNTKSIPYKFHNPTKLCIVKDVITNQVTITDRECKCNPSDDVCDPVCVLKSTCDRKCISDNTTGMCNPYCAGSGCDLNCYKNWDTGVCAVKCIKPNQRDGICSPSCSNVKKGVCDLDCYYDKPGATIEVGSTTAGLSGSTTSGTYGSIIEGLSKIKLAEIEEPCDPKNSSNWQCLIISKTGNYTSERWEDYNNEIWSCGVKHTWCAGELCNQAGGKITCHVTFVNTSLFPQTPVCCCSDATCKKSTRSECLKTTGFLYSENDTRCIASQPPGAQQQPQPTPSQKTTTQTKTFVAPGICDPDCPGLLPADKFYTTFDGIKVKKSDKICYAGCVNYTRRDGTAVLKSDGICDEDCKSSEKVCDPDCKLSMSSEICINRCSPEGNTTEKYLCCPGLIECPGNKVCVKDQPLACCGNGYCEGRPGIVNGWGSGNKTKWETFYTCPQDCKTDPGTKTSCSIAAAFSQSVCYKDILDSNGRWIGDEPVWRKDLIKVCNNEALLFLDRRNWNISEVIQSLADTPSEGWAWDGSRYMNACDNMQNADITISANENYNSTVAMCCSNAICDQRATYIPELAPLCKGVGYCADHAIGTLAILRSLGIPANDVYAIFSGGAGSNRHAWVVMKCDTTLPSNLYPEECKGNENKWLSVDSTGHFVKPLEKTSYNIMCLWWNDQGIYAQTEGRINSTHGFAYANDTLCSTTNPNDCADRHSDCQYKKLCKDPFGVDCLVP